MSYLTETTSGTFCLNPPKYQDWLTDELIRWVRDVPDEESAVENIQRIIRAYERRKTLWQHIKCFFLPPYARTIPLDKC